MKLYFTKAKLVERMQLSRLLMTANKLTNQPDNLEMTVNFVDKDEIRRLNKEYRSIDSVTDVLSFPMIEAQANQPIKVEMHAEDIDYSTMRLSIGEIFICREVAVKQAEEYGHSLKREICFLVLHGYLHLTGFDHVNDDDRVIMEAKQKEILDFCKIGRDKGVL